MHGSSAVDRWLARRGVTGPAARDRLLAVLLAVLSVAVLVPLLRLPVVGIDATAVELAVVAVVVLQCLVLAVRRSHPVACLWVVAVLQVVVMVLVPSDVAMRGPAVLVAAYTVGTLLVGRRVAVVTAAAVGIEAAGGLAVGLARGAVVDGLLGALGALVIVTASTLVGLNVGTHRRYVGLLREQAAATELAQEVRVTAAIDAERSRMARELHDVAAHHLSGMVVQASAVRRLLDRDLDAAREGVEAMRLQGRRTLDDLRMLVGVLRDPDGVADGAPVPGLGRLQELADVARGVGAEVTVTVNGEERDLAPLVDATCYRVVQEALSNCRQHAAGAPVEVVVEHGDSLVVTVQNAAAAAPTTARPAGVGLVGMRERVQLVGGTLEAGPVAGGGWRVRAVLPRREERT